MFELFDRKSFAFSAENPKGIPNGGTKGKDCEKLRPCIDIPAGETVEICSVEGEGMIAHMWLGGYSGRGFIIRIYWDGNEFPSVEAPIPAFFGCAYDEQSLDHDGNYLFLNSLPLLVAPCRGYNSYFEMPFKKSCRITVENRCDRTMGLYYMITGWYGTVGNNIGYFHATYRQEHPVQKGRSYVVLDNVEGRGKFLGVTLAAGMNGHNTCWVEGEPKMYIDGEKYPSINYTGTEDYFCGSFAFGNDIGGINRYQTFSAPYVGMFAILGDHESQYNSQKRFLLYRFHVKDEIYFSKSFKMVMDNLGWTGARYDDYTTVAYYYLDKPCKLPFELPNHDQINMR